MKVISKVMQAPGIRGLLLGAIGVILITAGVMVDTSPFHHMLIAMGGAFIGVQVERSRK